MPRSRSASPQATEDTRDRIVSVASTLFRQKGYDRTSVGSIAREVGITAPALYWHFDSKEEILLAFLEETLTDFVDRLEAAVNGAHTPVEQLAAFVRAYVSYQIERQVSGLGDPVHENSDLLRVLTPDQRGRIVQLHDRVVKQLRGIVKEGEECGAFDVCDAQVVCFAILTMCEYVSSWGAGARISGKRLAEEHAALALRMVGSK